MWGEKVANSKLGTIRDGMQHRLPVCWKSLTLMVGMLQMALLQAVTSRGTTHDCARIASVDMRRSQQDPCIALPEFLVAVGICMQIVTLLSCNRAPFWNCIALSLT